MNTICPQTAVCRTLKDMFFICFSEQVWTEHIVITFCLRWFLLHHWLLTQSNHPRPVAIVCLLTSCHMNRLFLHTWCFHQHTSVVAYSLFLDTLQQLPSVEWVSRFLAAHEQIKDHFSTIKRYGEFQYVHRVHTFLQVLSVIFLTNSGSFSTTSRKL